MTDAYRVFFNEATLPNTYVMPIHGNRPGDNTARQKKLAETLPEKPGIIAGRELRPGDKVPCRQGDIIAGVCSGGKTAREENLAQEAISITRPMYDRHERAVKLGNFQEAGEALKEITQHLIKMGMEEEIKKGQIAFDRAVQSVDMMIRIQQMQNAATAVAPAPQ